METVNSSLYKAIFNAQQQVENAKKKSQNPHLKSKYADLKAVHEAIGTALVDNGLLVLMRPMASTSTELKLSVGVVHIPSNEAIWWEVSMPMEKPNPQGFGSAMTYLRRYVYLCVLDMLAEDDDAHASLKQAIGENKIISLTKAVAA